jgi:hypothetical protein
MACRPFQRATARIVEAQTLPACLADIVADYAYDAAAAYACEREHAFRFGDVSVQRIGAMFVGAAPGMWVLDNSVFAADLVAKYPSAIDRDEFSDPFTRHGMAIMHDLSQRITSNTRPRPIHESTLWGRIKHVKLVSGGKCGWRSFIIMYRRDDGMQKTRVISVNHALSVMTCPHCQG